MPKTVHVPTVHALCHDNNGGWHSARTGVSGRDSRPGPPRRTPIPWRLLPATVQLGRANGSCVPGFAPTVTSNVHKPLTGTPIRRVLAYERYLTDLIDQRRAEPRDDLISMVVQAIDSGQAKLSLPELVSVLNINLVVAGHETTVIGIGNALHYLLTNREHWQALIDDPGLIPNAAEELLRLDGVLLGFFRTTTEAVEVRGVTIPAGESVLLIYASANRDAEPFNRATQYDPHRRRTGPVWAATGRLRPMVDTPAACGMGRAAWP